LAFLVVVAAETVVVVVAIVVVLSIGAGAGVAATVVMMVDVITLIVVVTSGAGAGAGAAGAKDGMHCEYHSLCLEQMCPLTQQVDPVNPLPPHLDQAAIGDMQFVTGDGGGGAAAVGVVVAMAAVVTAVTGGESAVDVVTSTGFAGVVAPPLFTISTSAQL